MYRDYLRLLLASPLAAIPAPLLSLAPNTCHSQTQSAMPPLLLAKVYEPGIALERYWISEKLDGVRAYWTGRDLLSRGGHLINAPDWFTRDFPSQPLDGELWIGRQRFDEVSAAVRRMTPDDAEWRHIRFHAFDLPSHRGVFEQRLSALTELLRQGNSPYLTTISQFRIDSPKALAAKLTSLVSEGAEGLMLHNSLSLYHAGRSDALLKLKPYQDAEATVIAHLPGKGKYTGMMGSLLVETAGGLRFKIGTGFSDAQRQAPPAIGAEITYRYHGKTARGIPRFASFIRVHEAE